ncbi:hypothetical protein [Neptuniibacter caesariensis]|uniref:Uncharacterized protein n=1 Tax=Neptuniibacter caesariensis TaxID=207954 RepID=A0A7U8C5V1_NEPCE|nr:hypothetical protein [Neptuniibacter caesariensis]EAR61261.1 hypothetical protein MED92_11059 [Oceanospirillum sp. MED92] [Neptuniibacter caesariensis]
MFSKSLYNGVLAIMISVSSLTAQAEPGEYNGQFKAGENPLVWSEQASEWISPNQFWLAFAETKGGLTWGQRTDYPEYDQVNEHDTMIIQLESGNCMMEFFHSRWRRANDVRRWDPLFNEYAGCPDVFK